MSRARNAAANIALGRKYIAESNKKGRNLSNLLDTDEEIRAERLALSKEGAKMLLEGTMDRNTLLKLKRTLDRARAGQTTDSNN